MESKAQLAGSSRPATNLLIISGTLCWLLSASRVRKRRSHRIWTVRGQLQKLTHLDPKERQRLENEALAHHDRNAAQTGHSGTFRPL
jgi:hypothetical protein